MSIFTVALAILVSLEFFYIMYLETFATASKSTARVFNMTQEALLRESVYNGLIAVLVLLAAFTQDSFWMAIFMIYIILVAAYGALTSDPKILLKQGGLAILTLLSIFF